jgi:hypothetical protein
MAQQSILSSLIGRFTTGSAKVKPTTTIGTAGGVLTNGLIQENELNPALTGRTKYKSYSTVLANTSIVSAGTRYFLNLIGKATWRFEPAQDTGNDSEAERLAKLVEDIFYNMSTPWSRTIRRAAMYRFYGFSIQEWTAKKRDDGVIGLEDIAPRAQITITRWDVEPTGKVLGVVQENPNTFDEVYLPRGKVLYICDDSLNDTPEGLGIFRNVVEASNRLARYEQLEGFGFETDLRGVPIGRVPIALINERLAAGTMTQEEATGAISALETFIKKHIKSPSLGIVLDSSVYKSTDEASSPSSVPHYDIDLLKGGNTTQAEIAVAIERINYEIARVLGVEHLLLGQSRGTQALSEDKSHNFAMIIDSTLTEIEEAVQRDLITTIFDLNGWDKKFIPDAKTEQVQMRNVRQITEALSDLASAGAVLDPEDPAIAEVRELLGLSAPIIGGAMDIDASLPGNPKPKVDPEDPVNLEDEG